MFRDMSTDPQEITAEELHELRRERRVTLVDVRSQTEFADATIPGSLNIPLFDNEERRTVGTLYKQESVQLATDEGLQIFARKLPGLYRQYERLPQPVVVYCWRGGMRSKATATLLSLMGHACYRIRGGYRAYRKWVVEQLEEFRFQPRCIVINGLTGSGKTVILQELESQGYPVLDLEGMARHRGSVFGQIGLAPNNQKTFDSLLLEKLQELKDAPYVLIEAESKRIGRVVVPEFLMVAKEAGEVIFVDMPPTERARNIMADYQPQAHHTEVMEAYDRIRSKIHTPIAAEIDRLLQEGAYVEACALLLEHHYDPRYQYAADKYPGLTAVCRVANISEAIGAVKNEIARMIGSAALTAGSRA